MNQYILYNPHAGNGRCEQIVRGAAVLKDRGCTPIYRDLTQIPSYAEFFHTLAPDDRVVLCGGDGTLCRFLNDTDGLPLPANLYYFAAGTGNDFLRDLGVPSEQSLVALTPYLAHLPRVTVNGKTYRFLNNVGFGIDGYCTEEGDRLRAQQKEHINYTAIAIRGLLGRFRPVNATVTVDGVERHYRKVYLAPTMNGRCYGGGMIPTPAQNRLSPEQTVSLMVFYGCGKLKALCVFPSIFKGRHIEHREMVDIQTGHDITVCFDRPTPLQIDGETISGVTSYHVQSELPLVKA